MNDIVTEGVASCKPGQQATADVTASAVPPLPHRRPRVREVSSRFMSPVVSSSSSSSSSGDLHLLAAKSPLSKHAASTPGPLEFQARQQQQLLCSKSVQRRRPDQEPLCRADENIPETVRSLDTPLGSHTHGKSVTTVQRRRAAVKLFKENGGPTRPEQQPQQVSDVSQSKSSLVCEKFPVRNGTVTPSSSRPDTPTVNGGDRIVPSRYRLTPNASGAVTAAAKLLRSSGMSLSARSSSDFDAKVNWPLCQEAPAVSGDDSATGQGSTCPNSPVSTRSLPDVRSSMSEVDLMPPVSESSKFSASPCSRSLNLPQLSCEESSLLHSLKTNDKATSIISKSANYAKMGSLCLPPQPTGTKLGADVKKGKKTFNNQEEAHSLKLLHNHYLQWRYANAKSEASMHAQRREAERKFYSLGVTMSDLREAVKRKRAELGLLKTTKTLSAILEAHMPYLDEWSDIEREYSTSLSEVINALLNLSLQLPIIGNVRVEVRDMEEALNSSLKVMEMIGLHIQSFMPKAEEMDGLMSELARIIGGEISFVDECSDLLFKTHTFQVEECSLRGQLIQLHHSKHFSALE